MKHKILFLGRFPKPIHGAAKMNELYFKSLSKKFNVRKIKINYSDSIYEIGLLNFKKFFGLFIVFFKLLFQLIFFHPNLIYFEIAPKGFAFIRDSIYVILCKLFRKKIIFAIHARGLNKAGGEGFKLRYYRFILKNTKIIILSKLFYNDVDKFFQKDNTYILPNGINDELNDKEALKIIVEREINKKLNLLFLSNMIEEKGPLDVLKFCKILKDKHMNFECSFVGAFSDEQFKDNWESEIKNLNLKKECKYLGPKYRDEKKEILMRSDFLIFPTKYPMECFPLVILEAFMFGIPVLSYDTGAISDILKKKFLGYVSYDKNIQELFGYFKKNIKKKDGRRIRSYFEKNYTSKIAEKNLNKIIHKELK